MKFLINTLTHWDEPPRARHQVTFALAKRYEVVFISANKLGFPWLIKKSIKDNLTVLIPYFPIGHKLRYRLPLINEIYQKWLFSRLSQKYSDYNIINFDFTATRIFNFFNNVIYYCNDSFAAISRHINPKFIANYHRKCESYVASHARFCIAVSPKLRDILLKFNTNSYEIPLGSPDINPFNIVPVFKSSKKDVIHICLMGIIRRYNISVNIINLLLANEKIYLTLIGPVEDKFMELIEKKEKVKVCGPLLNEALYRELNQADVTIAPYVSRLTDDKDSGVGTGSKIYHYFAVGKPVVISYMAGLDQISLPEGFLYIAKSEQEFPDLVLKAHLENNSVLIKQRMDYANNNTWEKRSELLIDIYSKNGSINQ